MNLNFPINIGNNSSSQLTFTPSFFQDGVGILAQPENLVIAIWLHVELVLVSLPFVVRLLPQRCSEWWWTCGSSVKRNDAVGVYGI